MPATTFLDGRHYTQLRGATFTFLRDTGHVVAGAVTSDIGGGGTTVWTPGPGVPCRIDSIGGRERILADRVGDRSIHRLVIPAGVAIDVTDRFAVDGRGTFVVTALSQLTSELVRTLEVAEA